MIKKKVKRTARETAIIQIGEKRNISLNFLKIVMKY
jgi:hypothetical protein